MSEVRLDERANGLFDLVLSHPSGNAIGPQLLDQLLSALEILRGRPFLRGVFLRAEGRIFSAGLDPRALLNCRSEAEAEALVQKLERALIELYSLPVPVVVGLHGSAVGTGLALALCADRIILSASPMRIGFHELQYGIPFAQAALEIASASLPMALSRRLIFDAELLDAEEAFILGFGHQRVEDATRAAHQWLEKVASRPLDAFRRAKLQLRAPVLVRARQALEEAQRAFAETLLMPATREALEASLGR